MMSVVGQESAPGLARRARRPTPAVAANGSVADVDAKLEQFASAPFGAHNLFSRDMVAINSGTSELRCGRPPRERDFSASIDASLADASALPFRA
jgi:hypothetical protein